MTAQPPPIDQPKWTLLIVEDNDVLRNQIRQFFEGEEFAARHLDIQEMADIDSALNLIRGRKVDLVILDVYRGDARTGGEQTGIRVLQRIKESGFVPVVLYTALPEGLEAHRSTFVRLVGKEAGGLERLREEVSDLFRLRIPQLNRAIVNHLDKALSSYMWGFVERHWGQFAPISDKPEFLRLVVQRLARTFAREGLEKMTAEMFDTAVAEAVNLDVVHPAEYYIKPPFHSDPMLGDIRVRASEGRTEYLVVLWPSCDMVSTGGRTPKTQNALCAKATLLRDTREMAAANTRDLRELLKNNRTSSKDRYHYLPGVWDIPDLLVDFQALEHPELASVAALPCLASLASPFAESLGARFGRYLGRLGTPDLDIQGIIARLRPPET